MPSAVSDQTTFTSVLQKGIFRHQFCFPMERSPIKCVCAKCVKYRLAQKSRDTRGNVLSCGSQMVFRHFLCCFN